MRRPFQPPPFPVADAIAAIIVFGAPLSDDGTPGRALARRLVAAAAAARRWPDPPVIVTGGPVATARPEAWAMRDALLGHGVDADRIVVEDEARDTLHSARRVAALLRPRGGQSAVIVVTSGYHALRCRLLLRLLGVGVAGVVAPDAERMAMGRGAWLLAVLREAAALPWSLLRIAAKARTRE